MITLYKNIFIINILFLLSFSSFNSKDIYKIVDIISLDNETFFREAIDKINKNGGIIHINTSVINIKENFPIELKGNIPGGIVGIKQFNGEYPRINFEYARNSGSFLSLTIYGVGKFLKSLIIENSGANGLIISGRNNLIDHIITRYNQYAGIFISNTANNNTFNYCYSYRNCDIKGHGINGNGFFSNGGSNNNFNYCFSWDNSNNGFSISSHEISSSTLNFTHSATWNNGNADIFSGKYDYSNGNSLDRNMLTVQHLINSDENFVNNYKKKEFSLENCTINKEPAISWISMTNGRTRGNGFQFGFAYNINVASIQRYADFCVSFDHKGKGFDNNYSKKYIGYFTNCVSFNNYVNYQLPYNFKKWSNNWGWGAIRDDQIDMEKDINKPANINSAIKNFYLIRNNIIKSVFANSFPDNINFNNVILNLN